MNLPDGYLITGADVFDGEGGEPYRADVRIRGGRVVQIGRRELAATPDDRVIDASGKWVMPGFIDIHTHYDGEIEVAPALSESIRHGVTTVFMGSCGLSMVMGAPDDLSDMYTRVEGIPGRFVKPLLQTIKDWDGPAQYYDHLRGLALGPNVACFLGHSTIRAAVMGLSASLDHAVRPRRDELGRMARIVEEALDAGYLGLSINALEFDKMDGARFRGRATPSVYARWREYSFLTRALRERGRVLQVVPSVARPLTMLRAFLESPGVLRPSLKTSIVALADTRAFRGVHRVLGGLAHVVNRALGGDVRLQAVPAPFELWVDGLEMPAFEEFDAGTQALHLTDLGRRGDLLRDRAYRARFARQWHDRLAPRVFHRDLCACRITACPDDSLVGGTFASVARARGQTAVDCFLDLLAEHGNDLRWTTVAANDRPDELDWILAHPATHIGFSDAGAHLRNMAFYNFPMRLLQFVRERAGASRLTMGRAVHKLTAELADWYGIDAGRLAEGARADIAVVDPAALHQAETSACEAQVAAFGGVKRVVRRNDDAVPWVFVNGRLACASGQPAARLGREPGFGRVLESRNNGFSI